MSAVRLLSEMRSQETLVSPRRGAWVLLSLVGAFHPPRPTWQVISLWRDQAICFAQSGSHITALASWWTRMFPLPPEGGHLTCLAPLCPLGLAKSKCVVNA